jgi:hypothetical protein
MRFQFVAEFSPSTSSSSSRPGPAHSSSLPGASRCPYGNGGRGPRSRVSERCCEAPRRGVRCIGEYISEARRRQRG